LRQRSPGLYLGLIVAIILGFAVVAGVWLTLHSIGSLGYEPELYRAQKTGSNSATLHLGSYPDSMLCHPNADSQQIQWVTYCPSTTLEVPPNSTITVIIDQYDSASTLVNDYFRQVRGTIGGTMTVNGKTMTEIGADQPGHTFTIQSTPETPNPIFVSVPLMGVPDNAPNVTVDGLTYPKPNVIMFQFHTGAPGTLIWHCYVPCGSDRGRPYGFSGPMSTQGYMAGTITVASY